MWFPTETSTNSHCVPPRRGCHGTSLLNSCHSVRPAQWPSSHCQQPVSPSETQRQTEGKWEIGGKEGTGALKEFVTLEACE